MTIARRPVLALNSPARFTKMVAGEGLFYSNFNRRFGILLYAATMVYPLIFIVVCATQSISPTMAAIHIAMYLLLLAFVWLSRVSDAATAFLVTHPFWFYSFSLFAYALGHWKSPEQDLYAPWLSSSIAFVTLLASIAGYALSKGLIHVVGLPKMRRRQTAAESRALGTGLVILSTPMVLLLLAGQGEAFLAAVSGLFVPMLWLGLFVHAAGSGRRIFSSPLMLFVLTVAFFFSVVFNARSMLFSFGLSATILYFAISSHPLRFSRLILFYLIANAASAFSFVMLSARLTVGHAESGGIVLKTLFSSDFAQAVLGFNTLGNDVSIVNDQLDRHDQYLLYMFDGRLGIGERLTEMPHMDIVMSRLPFPVGLRWGEIGNVILSALPSIGQSKDIIFNDRLVWDERLALYGNVGHPLVTAAGEFYAMGGFVVLFALFATTIAATLYLYEVSQRLFADRFVAAAGLICFSLFMVFSSTSVSALSVPIRIYPLVLVLYPFIKRAWALLAPRRSMRGTTSEITPVAR